MIKLVIFLIFCIVLISSGRCDDRERIINGQTISITDVPYNVLVNAAGSQCGGAILSKDWILTAGHCCTSTSTSAYSIRAGSTEKNSGGTTKSISQVKRHPGYSSVTYENDVCLLKLSSSLVFSESINAASLALTFPSSAQKAKVAGWGHTSVNTASNILHYGLVDIKPENFILKTLKSILSFLGGLLGKTQEASTLFYTENNDIYVCYGDSGSPLVLESDSKIIGVTSGTTGNCDPTRNYFTDLTAVPVKTFISTTTGIVI